MLNFQTQMSEAEILEIIETESKDEPVVTPHVGPNPFYLEAREEEVCSLRQESLRLKTTLDAEVFNHDLIGAANAI